MTALSALLSQIDSGSVLLPEFQRGYVWSRDQVRGLLRSLYLGYPVGGLLVWETQVSDTGIRQAEVDSNATRTLLLDGQQRMTSLYGVVRGKAPEFFEGDDRAFLGLHFNVDDETFEFYAPVKMKDDPRWVDVTKLFKEGLEPFIATFNVTEHAEKFATYVTRLNRVSSILNREFHLEKIVGEDKTVDVVVDIFNRVNSGGTKLSKGDLALAKIAAEAPETRQRMRKELQRWAKAGYQFEMDWLLRNITAVATGKAQFSTLDSVTAQEFTAALDKTVTYLDSILNLIAGRLGLDHDRVLLSRYAIPVLTRYLHLNGGDFPTATDREKALYWYIHAGMWGRFSGSTESMLANDYETLANSGLDGIIQTLRRTRGGNLQVQPADFAGFGRGARFYAVLYMITRVLGARDFGSNLELKAELLGKLSSLQIHHTFPKKVLYDHGYDRSEVNDVANFIFLTQKTNLEISKTPAAEYMPNVQSKAPGALESQWIPMQPDLWEVENYPKFLAERRKVLAAALNAYLDSLFDGNEADAEMLPRTLSPSDDDPDSREGEIELLLQELSEYAISDPLRNALIADPVSGDPLCVAEAFWPAGLQPGRGEPVILELDDADLPRLAALGYKVFPTTEALRAFVLKQASVDRGETLD